MPENTNFVDGAKSKGDQSARRLWTRYTVTDAPMLGGSSGRTSRDVVLLTGIIIHFGPSAKFRNTAAVLNL